MSLLASERQARIIDLLRRNGAVETNVLAEALGVSNMTIHRDLNKLADAGIIHKVHGGATLHKPVDRPPQPDICPMCNNPVNDRMGFIIHLNDGNQIKACCPHCGLMMVSNLPGVKSALVTDFLFGTVVSISQVTFLMNSNVTICCSPTILAFDKPEDAIRFQRGFGGSLADFDTARQYVMNANLSAGGH